ncbi:uncharacterized protein LOC104583303 [Brachypodium distachyon]|uniref:uncharacterized protein LOC104583303 n=1 Tax=Brachypodium distachyon TaxID=15368 RepID=UPI0005300193|nr:uncharacterized protein LOC104583303 [Brachypodium distachyon]|eukprot:XP_010233463.1 uncharacterized protein LOC104583303 [Brachypodium distachyon]
MVVIAWSIGQKFVGQETSEAWASLTWRDSVVLCVCVGFGSSGLARTSRGLVPPPPVNKCDRDLFSASTVVHIGNGRKATFWHDSWLDGVASKVIAPTIFVITRKKNHTVHDDLTDGAWIHALRGKISNEVQLDEFVSLWQRLQVVVLHPDTPDSITWRWTSDGIYTSSSAYKAQFLGSIHAQHINIVWKAKAKNKCKFFAWLLAQNKILTVDNLAVRGWSHTPGCSLCTEPHETGTHIFLRRPFTRQV